MATLEEILQLDSSSQVANSKKSKTVARRILITIPPIRRNFIIRGQFGSLISTV